MRGGGTVLRKPSPSDGDRDCETRLFILARCVKGPQTVGNQRTAWKGSLSAMAKLVDISYRIGNITYHMTE